MSLDPAANFVRGQTDAAVSDTDTTISVVDASIFVDPDAEGEYNVVIWDGGGRPDEDANAEIIRVTGRDTTADELTVTRAQEDTTAASHANGAAIQHSFTAKDQSDIAAGLSDKTTAYFHGGLGQ